MKKTLEILLLAEVEELDSEAYHGWHYISWNIQLPEDLLHRARDFVDWRAVVGFQAVSTPFLKAHTDRLIFPSILDLCSCLNKDEDFMNTYRDELIYGEILYTPTLPGIQILYDRWWLSIVRWIRKRL